MKKVERQRRLRAKAKLELAARQDQIDSVKAVLLSEHRLRTVGIASKIGIHDYSFDSWEGPKG